MKRANPEAQLHRAVAAFLSVALKPPTIWTTIGHGGGGKVRGAQLKAMGVQPGWPDIIIIHAAGHSPYYAEIAGIELKAGKGRQSPEQKAVEKAFTEAGGMYFVCRSVDDVALALASCMDTPLHARTA